MTTVVFDQGIFDRQNVGGISRYVCEIAGRLHGHAGFETTIVAPIHFNRLLSCHSGPKIGIYFPKLIARSGWAYRAMNRFIAPTFIAACGVDVLHRSYYSLASYPRKVKTVITVHDMIHELFPQYFPREKERREKRSSIERADQIICVSQNTATDLVRLLNVPPERITVTHLGLSNAFCPDSHEAVPAKKQRPYVLYVGHRWGYKNFERALRAYASSTRLRHDFDFIAFGGTPFGRAEALLIESLGLDRRSVRRATGPDESLAAAYRNARAFVFPSEYEGFGIPPLEAMSQGCPVACSDTSSIPEVVDDAGEYFSPAHIESIVQAIESVCYDEGRRQELIRRGLERCRAFSWDRCAAETAAVYSKAFAS